jgi:hypothetical protein
MSYVLVGVLVLAIVAIGATVLIVSAKQHRHESRRTDADPSYGAGVPGSDTAIVAPDPDSPLGDTSEHAGRQRDGETVAGQDADRSGGSRRPVESGYAGTGRIGERDRHRTGGEGARIAPPVDGGEGEGRRRI